MRFSIIVPVYNIEKYLDECISSVLCQDYDDYELILIDDGSTDSSGKICDKYALNNNKIHVIHKCNEGLSMARNCGIDEACGEFIIFLDGDDYWALNTMLSELSAYIIKNSPDIITFEGQTFRDNGTKRIIIDEKINKLSSEKSSYSFDCFIISYLSPPNLWKWCSWLYVIRKSIFNDVNLRFPKQRMYEDAYLTWRLLMKAKKIGTIPQRYYMYRQGRDGAITNTKTYKPIKDYIWVIENNLRDVKCMEFDDLVKKMLMGNFANRYFTCCAIAGILPKQERKRCIKELEEKKYIMNYATFPRYKSIAKLSPILGSKNLIRLLSFRYRWKMGIKIWMLKFFKVK